MADLPFKERSEPVQIVGGDEQRAVDVSFIDGKSRLEIAGNFTANVDIDEILGFDNIAEAWATVDTAGEIGDTVTVHVEGVSPDVVITLTAIQSGDRELLTDLIVSTLNADSNFNEDWISSRVQDNCIFHISSKKLGEKGERAAAGNFTVIETGTTVVTAIQDVIVRKGKVVSLTRDARDKRFGVLGISGEIEVSPGTVTDIFDLNLFNGGSTSMNVDGSATTAVFILNADSIKDLIVNEIRLYGSDNGIKFGQFLSINTNLTNGIKITIRSDNAEVILPLLKSTDDIKHRLSHPVSNFAIDIQAGRDDIVGAWTFNTPFPIRKAGSFGIDDFIKVEIRDNLSSIILLEFTASGFKKESVI